MSTATAEEALQRAKAIAARLSGKEEVPETPSSPSGGTSGKRKRWGVAPAIVSAAQEVLPGLANGVAAANKKPKVAETSSKKIWVRTNRERGAAHFKAYFASRLQDLEDELNAENGDDKVKLKLSGRGSSDKPALPGMPEEPLHILISGSDAAIAAAETPVDNVLTRAEQAPVEAVDPDEVYKESNADNSMALTTIGNKYTSNSAYRPATVAQLISNNPVHAAIGGGDVIEDTVNVPNGIVGFLIGRGGETITSIQARSGCKVQIQKESELVPGQTHRVITLQANSQSSIDQCREMIESMVQDRVRAAGGGPAAGPKDAKVQEALSMGHALVKVDVPDADVGLIIGKGGATIKAIQDQTGAQVQIPPSGVSEKPDTRTISITHPSEEGANMAKQRIEALLASKPSFSQQSERRDAGPQISIQVMIPDHDVGLCIGRQGCVIKEMQQKTGTRIQIPSQPTPGQAHRVATVTGTQEGCAKVQEFIERIITEQSSACVMSGSPQPNYYQQQHDTADPAWQAYYAAQAVAQQQGQQQQQQASAVPAVAAPAPAADTYYEQFFRYAYYYGEPAARQYYGAWSPPVGTPNPYGVNPNGISPAPAAASAAPAPSPSPASAPAPPPQQVARESSVRKVSNLPAWMTQSN
mmetsp:Transcript_48401/g.139201  ORF Transcript_48401/g.139201 Transcript_48401/m.139201 type:complete len:641 (-) Transcript_48401:2157-4079(-)